MSAAGSRMSSHADTIRNRLRNAADYEYGRLTPDQRVFYRETADALDALLAENQRLRDALDDALSHIAITIETLTRGDEFAMLPDGSNPLQATLDRLQAALDGTPSAAQTLEDATPDKEKAGS